MTLVPGRWRRLMFRSGSAVEARTPVDVPGVNSGNRPSASLSSLRAVDGGMRG
ncbi:hypothetical protein [Streptomyces sp. S8]|uniref:hypothetical protein n=1 Tax=Streptomyces sp. S8 TaxID=1837283 RepID=UPI00131EC519|nr:hypothetical protein [Streptomyces sp. S8]